MSSSTSMVDATGPADSTPQGACHRRHLQPRWWTLLDSSASPPKGPAIDIIFETQWRTLSDPLAAPPRGPDIDIFLTSVVNATGPTGSAPQWARH
jgi:hypothetical protein